MDELVFYGSQGDPSDKQHSNSFAYLSSIHTSKQYLQYRQCYSGRNGAVLTGIGHESKLIVASNDRATIQVYLYGKESPEQRIPLPEQLTCLEICNDSDTSSSWLIGGAKSGRIYVWELDSGLLLAAKECHYQSVTVVKYSKGFVFSGGADSRIVVWKILDLVTSEATSASKPFAIFTDHILPVTDLVITNGLVSDLRLYSSSRDCTVRCHNVVSKTLTSTYVLPAEVESLAADPAYRALYVGLNNGVIRILSLYRANPKTHILEAVGGSGSIVTLKPDPELKESIICHQQDGVADISITKLQVTFDGTTLVSGDSKGNLFTIDIATKQIQQKLKSLVGAISQILLFYTKADNKELETQANDKNVVRTIPTLKRVVAEARDIQNHEIQKRLGSVQSAQKEFDVPEFIDRVKSQQRLFTNFSEVDSTVERVSGAGSKSELSDKVNQLEIQLEQMGSAYANLQAKYEELYKEHASLLNR
ncbi:DEKNAAC105637 [Brettanomyces naardenensis]|uniref:Pre-rRNA-processing protein IPI3 n=1 Tax=Brettanomyces naardenensis TaxID=13370 RepID=A0A448YTX9_BRENA|nr:DEKNAAC105637 [Brettanomyces naardenensis]